MVGVGHVPVCLATSSPWNLNRSQSAIGRIRNSFASTPKHQKRRRTDGPVPGGCTATTWPAVWDDRIDPPEINPRRHDWIQRDVPNSVRERAVQTPSKTVVWAGRQHAAPRTSSESSDSKQLQTEFAKLSAQFEQLQERYQELDQRSSRPGTGQSSRSRSRPHSSWGRQQSVEAQQLHSIRQALCHRSRMSAFTESAVSPAPYALGKTFAANVPGIRIDTGNFATSNEPGIQAHHAQWRHRTKRTDRRSSCLKEHPEIL